MGMFPFAKRRLNPRLSDLSEDMRRRLPKGEVVAIEWAEYIAFGITRRRLEVTMLGCRKPLVWRPPQRPGRWVRKFVPGRWV